MGEGKGLAPLPVNSNPALLTLQELPEAGKVKSPEDPR